MRVNKRGKRRLDRARKFSVQAILLAWVIDQVKRLLSGVRFVSALDPWESRQLGADINHARKAHPSHSVALKAAIQD